MRTRRFILALVAVLAALAALAACGGEDNELGTRPANEQDDDRSSNVDEGSDESSNGDEGSSDDTGSGDDEGSSDDTGSSDAEEGSGGSDSSGDEASSGAGASGDFCALFNEYGEAAEVVMGGSASPEELQDIYDQFEEVAGPLADAAPDEVADDVDTLIAGAEQARDVLEDHDWDINEAITDPAFAEVMSEDFVDASIAVGEYAATNC